MSRRMTMATAVVTLLALHPACGEPPSSAADPYIERAADSEERAALTRVRDDIDDELRAVAAEKDVEIERLREENERLKARLAARAGSE